MTEDTEELEDTERTTAELAEILAAGGVVQAYLHDRLTVEVTLSDVTASVHYPLDEQAVAELASGLSKRELRLAFHPDTLEPITETDMGELALLGRVLEARTSLITPPAPEEKTA